MENCFASRTWKGEQLDADLVRVSFFCFNWQPAKEDNGRQIYA